jgi:hypothetical protein
MRAEPGSLTGADRRHLVSLVLVRSWERVTNLQDAANEASLLFHSVATHSLSRAWGARKGSGGRSSPCGAHDGDDYIGRFSTRVKLVEPFAEVGAS